MAESSILYTIVPEASSADARSGQDCHAGPALAGVLAGAVVTGDDGEYRAAGTLVGNLRHALLCDLETAQVADPSVREEAERVVIESLIRVAIDQRIVYVLLPYDDQEKEPMYRSLDLVPIHNAMRLQRRLPRSTQEPAAGISSIRTVPARAIMGLRRSAGWAPDTEKTWLHAMQSAIDVRSAYDGNDQLIGFGMLVGNERHALIGDVVVHEASRRKGVGRNIVSGLVATAERKTIEDVVLTYDPTEPWLAHFYQKIGFVPIRAMQLCNNG